ncbi:MAG: phospholipid methyltransferase [Casimicrobiaceae bacterium]
MTTLSFFLAWLADPLRVGAVSPSSPALADAITAEITPDCAPVIELGPGTGVFTRSLIQRGIPEERLALIERGGRFARKLERSFPRARVLQMDAARLAEVDPFDGERAGAVVSGLPLLLIRPGDVLRLLEGAFERLRPDAAFYQFTYGLDPPVPSRILDRLGLEVARLGGTFANVPPAAVYRIRRRYAYARRAASDGALYDAAVHAQRRAGGR